MDQKEFDCGSDGEFGVPCKGGRDKEIWGCGKEGFHPQANARTPENFHSDDDELGGRQAGEAAMGAPRRRGSPTDQAPARHGCC
jgi:hypothetical protein